MRILILRNVGPNSMDDIYHQTEYLNYEWIKSTNVGNKLWLMGLVSSISTSENQIDFLESYMDADYINANYDICIKPEANIFSPRFIGGMERHVDRYDKVTIPIYVIACGAAAKSYDELDELCVSIKEPATRFIKSIYKSGGEFCLRGYFTKEMFDKLGFHDAVVTGCPSMYQFGRKFTVDDRKVSKDNFKPALNGMIELCKKPLSDYSKSEFFDQGLFYPVLYHESVYNVKEYINTFGIKSIELINDNRLNLLIDMQDWMDYLIANDFNFSCGSRIHGNIMPIISGIPAAICPPDSRVREMAEFFDIPMISDKDLKKKDLYEIYLNTSYKKFNKTFAQKYDAYEKFLIERGIVKAANQNGILNRDRLNVSEQRLKDIDNLKRTDLNRKRLNQINKHRIGYCLYERGRKIAISLKAGLS